VKVVHFLPAATLLAAAVVIIAPACAVAQSTSWTVPDTVEVNGTTYVDCRAVSGYPFAVAGDLRTLRGKGTTEMGTRSFPWICNAVEGLLLFRASDGEAIYDPQFDGRMLQVRGRDGEGKVRAEDFFSRTMRDEKVDHAFIVSQIVGWQLVEGFPKNDSGEVSSQRSQIWVKIP